MSKAQIEKTAQRGGNLFSLVRPLLAPAAKALATAGLSFGAEIVLKKIFGNRFDPQEIQLCKLTQLLTPESNRKMLWWSCGIRRVSCGWLPSVFLSAISLVKKMLSKGTQVRSQRSLPQPPPPRGKGMQVRHPPFFGSWEDYEKNMRFRDVPLFNVYLMNWCKYLGIPIKGIFSRKERKPLLHSPYIINIDDFGSLGTHWVCCWGAKHIEYFEWELETTKMGTRNFLRNDAPLQ